MRKIAILLLIVMLFAGCGRAGNSTPGATSYSFSASDSGIFPFYCVGEDDKLWRIERHGAYLVDKKVSYSSGNTESGFVRYLSNTDTVVFATDVTVENGVKLCTLCVKVGSGKEEAVAASVRIDSIRLLESGDMLFINGENTLYFRRDGINIKIQEDVAQGEFVGEDTFLYRLKKGKYENGEFSYPIYSATAEYRNHLTDALDIVAADHENGKAYIIRDKHTVQKRTSSVEVARCFVYADGEILFDIPSVVLSQFEENKHVFLVSCNESEPTLKYDLFRIDGGESVLKASDIISGRYVSADRSTFAYETLVNGTVMANICDYTDYVHTCALDNNSSLDSIYAVGGNRYMFLDGTVRLLGEGGSTSVLENVSSVRIMENALICFKEKTPPYNVYVIKDKTAFFMAGNVQSNKLTYKDGYLYYYLNASGDLGMSDSDGRGTAFISNTDTDIGFICFGGTVAVAKSDDKTLLVVSRMGMTDCKVKIKSFVKEV